MCSWIKYQKKIQNSFILSVFLSLFHPRTGISGYRCATSFLDLFSFFHWSSTKKHYQQKYKIQGGFSFNITGGPFKRTQFKRTRLDSRFVLEDGPHCIEYNFITILFIYLFTDFELFLLKNIWIQCHSFLTFRLLKAATVYYFFFLTEYYYYFWWNIFFVRHTICPVMYQNKLLTFVQEIFLMEKSENNLKLKVDTMIKIFFFEKSWVPENTIASKKSVGLLPGK